MIMIMIIIIVIIIIIIILLLLLYIIIRRTGYMEIMKRLWEEKGYILLGLTAQNLRDRAAYYGKSRRDVGGSSTGGNEDYQGKRLLVSTAKRIF